MDNHELKSLIAGGETLTLEFKGERRGPLNDRDLVEAVVCLATAEGGLLLANAYDRLWPLMTTYDHPRNRHPRLSVIFHATRGELAAGAMSSAAGWHPGLLNQDFSRLCCRFYLPTGEELQQKLRHELGALTPEATVKENLIVAPKAAPGRRKKKGATSHE